MDRKISAINRFCYLLSKITLSRVRHRRMPLDGFIDVISHGIQIVQQINHWPPTCLIHTILQGGLSLALRRLRLAAQPVQLRLDATFHHTALFIHLH